MCISPCCLKYENFSPKIPGLCRNITLSLVTTNLLYILLALTIFCNVTLSADICTDGSTPAKQDELSQCCWYESSSCCTNSSLVVQFATTFVPVVYEALVDFQNQTTATSAQVQQCTIYIESLICTTCAPDSGNIYVLDTETGNITLTICDSWCDNFYSACSPFLTIPGANITATNGTELCNALSGGMLVGSNVTVVVNSTGCFAGPDANEIGQLTCNPWPVEDFEPEDSSDTGGNFWYFFLLFIGVAVVLGAVCVIALLAGGFVYYRKKKAAAAVTNSEPYPQLEELE